MTITVKASLFKAASICMSTEETRYYLNGVYIEPCAAGGAILTATDGHRLVCIHDKDGSCTHPAIVSIPKGALTARIPDGNVVVDDNGLFRHGTYISLKTAIIDGTYPDYRHVVRLTEKNGLGHAVAPAIKGRYLAEFGKVAAILAEQPGEHMAIRLMTGLTENDPALIVFPSSPNAFGIIMPMRANKPPAKYQWFIAGVKETKPAKKAKNSATTQKAA